MREEDNDKNDMGKDLYKFFIMFSLHRCRTKGRGRGNFPCGESSPPGHFSYKPLDFSRFRCTPSSALWKGHSLCDSTTFLYYFFIILYIYIYIYLYYSYCIIYLYNSYYIIYLYYFVVYECTYITPDFPRDVALSFCS